MLPESFLFPRNTEQYNHLSCISFKLIPLCNYTLLSATVKVSETFLEAILWKLFQLFRRIRNDVSSTTKSPPHQCWFQSREQLKISWIEVRRVWGAQCDTFFFFCKEILDQTDRCSGALSWRRNQLLVLDFSRRFLLTSCLRRRRMSMYVSVFTVLQFPSCSNSSNYTSEFRELFEGTTRRNVCTRPISEWRKLPYVFKFAIGNGGAESRMVHRRAFYLVTKSADGIPGYELYTKEYSYFILDYT